MKIIRADHLGMCFGVRDAVALAVREQQRGPVTILGDLVHNERVVAGLRARGICTEADLDAVRTERVMITAHGASDRVRAAIRERGLNLLEATCPLVRYAHEAVAQLVREGFHPVIIGKAGHVEVRGLTGDLAEFDVVENEAEMLSLRERARFGVAAQTTQPLEKVERLTELLRQRCPRSEVRLVDTVCRPTKQRQIAAAELARNCDVVVVIGGCHSNNTRELVASCRRFCGRVHHVQTAEELDPEWFHGAGSVGITAGTSTPDTTIDEVEERLKAIGEFILEPTIETQGANA